MFDHVSIGVADIGRSKKFYDAALKPLGYSRLSDGETSLGYGDKAVQLWLGATQKPVKPDTDSGLHFCFVAKDRAAVDAFTKSDPYHLNGVWGGVDIRRYNRKRGTPIVSKR